MRRTDYRRLFVLASTAVLLSAATASHAQPTTVPTGLNPGDQYRLAFVTSTTTNANSASIAYYNAFVTAVADAEPALLALGTTWNAIGSTTMMDARDNTATNPGGGAGVPIYLLNDTKLADDNSDLWDGTVDTPPCVEEDGTVRCPDFFIAWTGTATDGTAFPNNELAAGQPIAGIPSSASGDWVFGGVALKSDTLSMMAISGVITVPPLPPPTTVPTELNPGDQYRLAFVTSTTTDATSTSIATYNAFVTGVANSEASLVALGTTWTAIGSTTTVDARDNTATNPGGGAGVPIYLLNDTKLADDNSDLWDGTVDTPPCVEEDGTVLCPALVDVWTGTDGTGAGAFTLGTAWVTFGFGEKAGGQWIHGLQAIPGVLFRVYAISNVLTVPDTSEVPALSGWSLLLLSGTLLVVGIRRFARHP